MQHYLFMMVLGCVLTMPVVFQDFDSWFNTAEMSKELVERLHGVSTVNLHYKDHFLGSHCLISLYLGPTIKTDSLLRTICRSQE